MENNPLEAYRNKKVLITGHTGFKGSWLTQWLLLLGADLYGYALEPPTSPSLFDQLGNENRIGNFIHDIRDIETVKKVINEVKPDVIFHLAAQSLVRESYENPVFTWESNVNGTMNLLEAVRSANLSAAIVVVTSDKCYDNKEWIYGYRETDSLGGYDPYSASKGAAEIIVSSWRNSFFNVDSIAQHGVRLASARAGNVIGGGDWSDNRIVPDCFRALQANEPIGVRNPYSTRPWQHVLESLGGYLLLGSKLIENGENISLYCDAYNFGPFSNSNKTVERLVTEILKHWPGEWNYKKEKAVHEAFLLNLNIDKALQLLNWNPVWDFETTIAKTVEWYKNSFENPDSIAEITNMQINEYSSSFTEKINRQ